MVCRMNSSYYEIEDKQDMKRILAWYKTFWLLLGIYEVGKNDNILKSVLSENIKIDILANDDTMKSVKTTHCAEDEMLFLNERCFFKTKMGYKKTEYGVGLYTSQKPVNIKAIDKFPIECVCNNGSIVKCLQNSVLQTFALDKAPGWKKIKTHN